MQSVGPAAGLSAAAVLHSARRLGAGHDCQRPFQLTGVPPPLSPCFVGSVGQEGRRSAIFACFIGTVNYCSISHSPQAHVRRWSCATPQNSCMACVQTSEQTSIIFWEEVAMTHLWCWVQVACTKAGAFHINPREENSILEKMPGGPSNAAPSACAWNSRTDGYYVAWNDGSISCLNRRH